MIEIVEHREDWRSEYQRLATSIRNQMGDAEFTLHHIGSTAVSGLAAKDVIDIQLSLKDLSAVSEKAIETIGFEFVPNRSDHCPPGMALPKSELQKRFYKCSIRPANLHIREIGRFNQRYPLLCRDFLRSSPEAAEAYAEIKRELANHFAKDQSSYYAIKDPTFDLIMVAAEAWAVATDWAIPPED